MAKLLVVDTETGGLDPALHSILSVGAVLWEDGRVGTGIELPVRESPIVANAEALRINRISLEDLERRGLAPAAAVRKLEEFIGGSFPADERVVLAGHNVGFDAGFIKRLYRLAGEDFEKRFSHRLLDTASILRFLGLAGVVEVAGAGLDAATARFGIEVAERERHTALGDAQATAQLISRLIEVVRR